MAGLERASASAADARALKGSIIKEVILENFMSYEYARIPFKPGLNLICGPNGAGKSSILLAVSVALGQTYTERSRRLSDLVRRGKSMARVTLMFDNTPREGRRPVPFSRSDTFMLSRYLRGDGSYWYEADYREVSKGEVVRLFRQFGVNPDNLLIIMHQGMVEEFSVTSPQEKLRMVEEAVGFSRYRESLREAQEHLAGLVSEEASTLQLMESAGQTLEYWKEVYDRYLTRKGFLEKRGRLERELVWSQAAKHERALAGLRERLESRTRVLNNTVEKLEKTKAAAEEAHGRLTGLQTELQKFHFSLLRLERERAAGEAVEKSFAKISKALQKQAEPLEKLLVGEPERREDAAGPRLKAVQQHLEGLRYLVGSWSREVEDQKRRGKDLDREVQGLHREISRVGEAVSKAIGRYVDLKVSEATLGLHKRGLEREISEIKRGMRDEEQALQELAPRLSQVGPRLETERTPSEVAEELKVTAAQLQSVGEVPEEAEDIYTNYLGVHDELKRRLGEVQENKKKTLEEVEERKRVWKETLQKLVERVNPVYQGILSEIDATGFVRLTDTEDLEEAGLELHVGFRGAGPTVLDAYTQSGGERSVAVMGFLLSLQREAVSPFRAVDEFDVHMDPRNREAVFKTIFTHIRREATSQHIMITPSQLTVLDEDVHLLFVQNVRGRSEVEEVRRVG